MNYSILLALSALFTANCYLAQGNIPTAVCNKWTVGVNMGSPLYLLNSEQAALSFAHQEYNIRRNFNPRLGLKFDLHTTQLNFKNALPATSMTHLGLQANYGLLAPSKKLQVYLHGGVGYTAMVNRAYYNGPSLVLVPFIGSVDEVVQLCVGVNPSITLWKGLAINADLAVYLNSMQDNSFDFLQAGLTSRSGLYSTAALGLSYTFGCYKASKNINQQSNPTTDYTKQINALQNDLDAQKAKLNDDDNDGVINAIDLEPNTPQGMKVDSKGVSIPAIDLNTIDTDQDGFVDAQDECPTVKGINKGCPEMTLEEKDAKALYDYGIYDILFVKGSFYINPSYFPILDKVVQYLKENPEVIIDVTGHADIDGADDVNNKLSEARVQEVAKYLMSKGVKANRLVVSAKGKKQIKYAGNTLEADAANRRVSFSIHR